MVFGVVLWPIMDSSSESGAQPGDGAAGNVLVRPKFNVKDYQDLLGPGSLRPPHQQQQPSSLPAAGRIPKTHGSGLF